MQIAGVLGWTPDQFWKSTLPELLMFFRGWQLANGVSPEDETTPLSREEYEVLKERFK